MKSGQASKTALGVARWLVLASGDPQVGGQLPPGWRDDAVALMSSVSRRYRWEAALSQRSWVAACTRAYERLTVPHIGRHLAMRKAFMDAQVRAAVAAGARQLVVVGAGFDTLTLRVGRDHPGLLCAEVDHPDSQEAKRAALEAAGIGPVPLLVPCDLAVDDLAAALATESRWQPDVPSVLVAEGLTMYLAPEAVERMLAGFVASSAPGSRAILTYAEPGDGRRGSFHRFAFIERWLLRRVREPFLWLPTAAEFAALVERAGFTLIDPGSGPDLGIHPELATLRTTQTGLREYFAVAMR